VARFRLEDLRGLPPNLPFAREDAAFRLDLTEPRHAGQNDTKSIRWVGHFGIAIPPNVEDLFYYSNVLGSFLQWVSNLASFGPAPAAYNGFGAIYGSSTR
jgi:hypothetical protein